MRLAIALVRLTKLRSRGSLIRGSLSLPTSSEMSTRFDHIDKVTLSYLFFESDSELPEEYQEGICLCTMYCILYAYLHVQTCAWTSLVSNEHTHHDVRSYTGR